MSSADNKQLMQEIFAGVAVGDGALFVEHLADDVVKTIPLRFIADGDLVVIEARGEMTSKAGVPYNNEYCMIYRLHQGKIVEITEYNDSLLCERVLGPLSA